MSTKVCSKCKEVKKLDGFSKNKVKKDGYRAECKVCVKIYQAEYYAANPEKRKEVQAKYYTTNSEKIKITSSEYKKVNSEKIKITSSEYYADNSEKLKDYQAEYQKANPEKIKEYCAEYYAANSEKLKDYQAEWCAANPEKGRAYSSNYRAAKLEAIPSWLTKEDYQAMEAINKEADRLTKETGIKHEVDHIHPLQGKLVCGLQCPTNLQILTKSQNCSKGNRFTPYVES